MRLAFVSDSHQRKGFNDCAQSKHLKGQLGPHNGRTVAPEAILFDPWWGKHMGICGKDFEYPYESFLQLFNRRQYIIYHVLLQRKL